MTMRAAKPPIAPPTAAPTSTLLDAAEVVVVVASKAVPEGLVVLIVHVALAAVIGVVSVLMTDG